MKHLFLCVTFGFLTNVTFSQNKKEQIAQLTTSLDSLNVILENERIAFEATNKKQNTLIQQKNKQIEEKGVEISHLNKQLTEKKQEIEKQATEINRINGLLVQKQKETEQLKAQISSLTPSENVVKRTNTPTLEKSSEKQEKSKLMQDLEKNKYIIFECKTYISNRYAKDKKVDTKTRTNSNPKYPFKVTIKIDPQFKLYGSSAMELQVDDLEYGGDVYPEIFDDYHIDGNIIRALRSESNDMNGRTVFLITFLTNAITIEEYNLETSMFPSNSQQDEYAKIVNDFIFIGKQGKFELKSSETYTK